MVEKWHYCGHDVMNHVITSEFIGSGVSTCEALESEEQSVV